MYVLMCPCILDPTLRARGITNDEDLIAFSRSIERCRRFGIEMVSLPCPETLYLGKGREPHTFTERLDTPAFAALLGRLEDEVREIIARKGAPLAIIGVDSSPSCGATMTYYSEEKQQGRGAFLDRFPDIKVIDVKEFARYRIYLAGPLFTEAEQTYNRLLYDLLTRHFFEVYLPQEVGDTSHSRSREEHQAIFRQHIEALRNIDMVVAVVDGADADSGTAWEMGYAYALGTPVVSLRTDFRHAGHHERVNLMLEESSTMLSNKEELHVVLNSLLL